MIGGDISTAAQPLLAGVREVIFQRSLPLATGQLRIVPSRLGERAGAVGAAAMVIERVLAPDAIDSELDLDSGFRPWLDVRTPVGAEAR